MSTSEGAPLALITGGAGFIGINLAYRLLREGQRVLILDNFSRAGVRANVRELLDRHPGCVQVSEADVRDEGAVARAVAGAHSVYHLAAQVAVTTSLDDPVRDFESNARGTLNVLEAVRRRRPAPSLIFTSTNKVYGALGDVPLEVQGQRYAPIDPAVRDLGIGESRPLDFHSPYGCSKGAADQYVLDYARSFDIPAVVFRMSCIYGPHQFGNEDQGWVAHFLIRARAGEPIGIFGDGRQVRDVLFVDDLMEAFMRATAAIDRLRGSAFNIGGGPGNTLSLLELLELMRAELGMTVRTQFGPWRTGDQRYYVTDTRHFESATGWRAGITPREGLKRLLHWLEAMVPGNRSTTRARAVSQ